MELAVRKNQARLLALLTAALFLLALLVSNRLWFRLDMTKNKAYTISEVSRNLYREIEDQVTITYFISEKLRLAHPLPGEISDLIREYAAHSRGKIRFVEKDPAKADILAQVEKLGIVPQQIELAEKNETTIATVYTGLLIEYLDRESVMPIVFSLNTLEYDLSTRIRSLVRNTERELGVIVGDSYRQWNSEYGLLNRELEFSGIKVRLINPGDYISDTLPALFVLGGAEDLNEFDLYLIDRYIMGGGKVLFAQEGVTVDTRGNLEARPVSDKGLLAMLANYGVVIRQALVLDRTALNLTFQTQSGNGTVIRSVRYPHWIGVRREDGKEDNALIARFGGLDLYWASPLELHPPPGVDADILFTSTESAWLQERNFVTNPNWINEFYDEEEETTGPKILGACLVGVFPGAFEGRRKPVRGDFRPDEDTGDDYYGDEDSWLPDLPLQKKAARIIVIGDTDFAGAIMQANRGEERNLDFLLRAAEWLSSDDDIISIRNRESDSGRLDRIYDREKRDAAMTFSRILNTIVIPLTLIIAGLIFGWKRRRKAIGSYTSTSRAKEPPLVTDSEEKGSSIEV